MSERLTRRLQAWRTAAASRGLGPWSCLWLLGLLVGLALWAEASQDDDFYFPDAWRALGLALIFGFLASAWIRRPWLRIQLRLFLLVLPCLGLLTWEMLSARRDERIIHERIQLSEDRLLRYHYRPGAATGSEDAQGRPLPISADGLWDLPHARPKPAETFRIVVLGDSVPNDGKLPFPARFHQLLQQLLQGTHGWKVEVVNVSCEGYNTLQEVRLFERVGLGFQPDLVLVAYVLNDPFLQNGGHRRLGNSYVAHRIGFLWRYLLGRSACEAFLPLHDRYAFDLVVTAGLERLALLAELHHFPVLLAVLPIVEEFDDPICAGMYHQVSALGERLGMGTLELVEAFRGRPAEDFRKLGDRWDLTHPNAEGHRLIAARLAERIRPLLEARAPAEPLNANEP
ncbi:MAG TPA: SGNH/GDSL hydrolase family protein [Myxococcota bacterium]|nr:SGNH/GDSL hydrolase family protein [Myxococcota bacterium]HRY94060.1 SGNH/GDSL hydrolase family protein [Myxococcota bacterium]HSA21361.1 SGNH/GDSL hydrolase family protein [Myxococcota bacterium]